MTVIFSDTFTEPTSNTLLDSHVPDLGTGWTLLWNDGSLPTISAIAASDTCKPTLTADSGVAYVAEATYPSANYEVQWTFVQANNSADRPYYVFLRLADIENMYAVRMSNVASGCQLYKKVAGTWTALGSAVTIAVGSVCKLQINGSTLKLFDDGVEVISVTDTALTATGKAGIGSGGGSELVTAGDDSSSTTEIDTLTVNDLGVEETAFELAFVAQDDIGFHLLESDPGWSMSSDALRWNIQGEDMAAQNKITGLVVGQYGASVPLTIVDDDGIAIDLSTYTGISIKARSPDARTTLSFTGALVGGGTGGQITFTPAVGNTFDRDGAWEGQIQFTKASVLALTVLFKMEVEKKI